MSSNDRIEPNETTTDAVGARIGAQIVDLVVIFVLLIVVISAGAAMIVETQSRGMVGLLALGSAFLSPIYGAVLETYWDGQTVGKKMFDVRVVGWRGTTPSFGQAFVRNLPGVVLFSWVTSAVALASMASTDYHQRLFDQAADTYVVNTDAHPMDRQADARAPTYANR
jgi:uncharacterized RDD family membrane protein YckC